jgi:hypothetical protein
MKMMGIIIYLSLLICGDSADGDIMPPMVGGQYDNNGCIIGAGYSWCDASQSCIRQWETPCEDNYQDCGDCLKRQRSGENIACPMNCDITDCLSGSDCDQTHFCRPYTMDIEGPKECVPFSVEGGSCGGYTLPVHQMRCSLSLECVNIGQMADAPGQCMRPCKEGSIRDNYGNCFASHIDYPVPQLPPTHACSDVMCMMYCENGFEQDENGCDICICSEVIRSTDECDIPYIDCGNTYLCPKVTEITRCSEGGLPGYTTYQLSIIFNPNKNIKNLFAIYGDATNRMIIPPAKNVNNIFGSNVGGVSPQIVSINPDSEYDSWMTIGVTNGNINNEISTIGIPFEEWCETSGLTVTNGAIFLMNPELTMDIHSELIIGQITIVSGISENVFLNFRGKYTDEYRVQTDIPDNSWSEEQIQFILDQPLSHSGNSIPLNCKVWYDGCNTCQVNNGNIGACTRMMCFREDTPYCMDSNEGH